MHHRRTAGFLPALAALALAVQGCADRVPTATDAATPAAHLPAQAAASQADMEALARGIAAAMGAPEIRARVLEDLRDSPFPEHRLHLASYLRGERGAPVAAAAAEKTGMSPGRLAALLSGAGGVQLSMPLAPDRIEWAGTRDVVVAAHAVPESQVRTLASLPGFRPGGEAVAVPLGVSLPYPLLVVAPAQGGFGADPEARRAAAPRRLGGTVSTVGEEMAAVSSEIAPCSPTMKVCFPEPTYESPPGGQSLPSGFSYYSCTYELPAGSDPDADGIRNDCEYEMAYAFRPYLQFSTRDNYKGRQSYWAVRKGGSGEIKVIYLLGYFRDSGENTTGYGWHYGDSEFIVMTIRWAGGVWGMSDAFLSAHWHKYGWDSSSLRGYSEFTWPSGVRKRPKVWVADSKHANYSSQSKCGEGANYWDSCNSPEPYLQEVEVLPGRNIGNGHTGDALLPCDTRVGDPSGYRECFWGFAFTGWTGLTPAAGGYGEVLDWAGF